MKKVANDGSGTTERYVMAYDENGNPFSISYYSSLTDSTPDTYYYVLNLQGDVFQLRDSSNNVVCIYTYDAWGKLLSVTNASGTAITDSKHIANVNPFRYRGYYYDVEIGFYYCNSRYYDPEIGRFINADVYTSTGQGFGGYNMFAYCQNNPVMYTDSSGEFFKYYDEYNSPGGASILYESSISSLVGYGSIGIPSPMAGSPTNPTSTVLTIALATGTTVVVSKCIAEEAQKLNQQFNKDYYVYALIDENKTVQYVGRTCNVVARKQAHRHSPYRKHLTMVVLNDKPLTYVEARGLEQKAMLECHTLNTANKMNNQINGVYRNNRYHGIFMTAGQGALFYLENQISNNVLNIMER